MTILYQNPQEFSLKLKELLEGFKKIKESMQQSGIDVTNKTPSQYADLIRNFQK